MEKEPIIEQEGGDRLKKAIEEFVTECHLSPEEIQLKIEEGFKRLKDPIESLLKKENQLPSSFVEALKKVLEHPVNTDITKCIELNNDVKGGYNEIPEDSDIREEAADVKERVHYYFDLLHKLWEIKEVK